MKGIGKSFASDFSGDFLYAPPFMATTAKYRGVPIEMISESLGHKSIKTTQIYLKGFGLKERTEVNKMNLSLREELLNGGVVNI